MSWVRIWVHLVFSTKNRTPFLKNKEVRREFCEHIKQNADNKELWLDCVNGYQEHIHCLVSLHKDQSVSNVAKLIKGESSHWINQTGMLNDKFRWQDAYWAVSVSESHLQQVRNYIHRQEEHHRKVSFKEEIDKFMAKYGWELIKG